MKKIRFIIRNLWILFLLLTIKYLQMLSVSITFYLTKMMRVNYNDPLYPEKYKQGQHQLKRIDAGYSSTVSSLIDNFITLMEVEEIYKNPGLNEEAICRALATNRTYLSKEIRKTFNTCFRELLNKYRLEKAKELLLCEKHKHLSISGISELVGYRNYGTFNSLFKKNYGLTPREWRDQVDKKIRQEN